MLEPPRNEGAYFYVLGTHMTSGPADGDGPSTVGPPLGPLSIVTPSSGRSGVAGIRRGPGRPRLRPTGPGHQGYRNPGYHHGKKLQRPLPVPIRSHQTIASVGHHQKVSSSSSHQRPTGSSSLSVAVNAANSTLLPSSVESRPFGFYTQQQQPRGSS